MGSYVPNTSRRVLGIWVFLGGSLCSADVTPVWSGLVGPVGPVGPVPVGPVGPVLVGPVGPVGKRRRKEGDGFVGRPQDAQDAQEPRKAPRGRIPARNLNIEGDGLVGRPQDAQEPKIVSKSRFWGMA